MQQKAATGISIIATSGHPVRETIEPSLGLCLRLLPPIVLTLLVNDRRDGRLRSTILEPFVSLRAMQANATSSPWPADAPEWIQFVRAAGRTRVHQARTCRAHGNPTRGQSPYPQGLVPNRHNRPQTLAGCASCMSIGYQCTSE